MRGAYTSNISIQWECLEMQSLVSNPDYCHWEPEVWVLSIHWINVMHRAIWDSSHWGECSVVIQMCWEHSPWLAVLFTFYISFCFQRGCSKEIWYQKNLENKRQELLVKAKQRHHDRSTSSEADQMHFPKASHKDNLPSRWCGQALSMRGDPRRSCSQCVHSGGCRSSRPTALKESLSGPWTAQMFCVHTSPEPITAESSDKAEMDPGLGLFLPRVLCRWPVTDIDICRQSQILKTARERLVMALRADRLAKETEREPGVRKNVLEN